MNDDGATNELSRRLGALPPVKRAMLERRLHTPPAAPSTHGIPRRTEKGAAPLASFAQERLWFFDQLGPQSPLYNIARAVHLKGPLDLGALQAALDAIVARHEAVRTTLHWVDGRPVQRIAPPGPVNLERVELDGSGAHADPEAVQRLLVEEARRPFDLSRDLMLRATVFRLHATPWFCAAISPATPRSANCSPASTRSR